MNQEQNYQPYEMNQSQTPNDEQNNKHANTLCAISLICELIPLILSGIFLSTMNSMTEINTPAFSEMFMNVLSTLELLLVIAGLILMIYVRVKYPKNIFGKVLMWLYIALAVIGIIIFIVYLIFVMIACISCISCLQELG